MNYMTIDNKYCMTCKRTDDLMATSKKLNENLGILYKYYICHTCNNARRKRYYNNGKKDIFMAANLRYRIKKQHERYETEVAEFGKPRGWKAMNNRQKAKYIRDQREKLNK